MMVARNHSLMQICAVSEAYGGESPLDVESPAGGENVVDWVILLEDVERNLWSVAEVEVDAETDAEVDAFGV